MQQDRGLQFAGVHVAEARRGQAGSGARVVPVGLAGEQRHPQRPERGFLHDVAEPLLDELGTFLGPLILEIQENDIHEAEFCTLLDAFLRTVRSQYDGPLAVELRTSSHLTPRYLRVVHNHGVAHVLNSWTRMPAVGLQWDKLRALAELDWPFFLVRALLRPGMRYEDASIFDPYDRLVTRAPDVRADILRVLREAPQDRTCYVLANNHLEGHSPGTISELQTDLWGPPS